MSDTLWSEIDPPSWRSTPCTVGRIATETDVKDGRAVFYARGGGESGHAPADIPLPQCAMWHDPDGVQPVPGVIIQAEHGDRQTLIGFRPLAGGNVLALLTEFELISDFSGRDER